MRKFISICLLLTVGLAIDSVLMLLQVEASIDNTQRANCDFEDYYVTEISTGKNVYNVAAMSNGAIFISVNEGGGNFGLYKSTDKGQTWNDLNFPDNGAGKRLLWVDPFEVLWVGGASGSLYKYAGGTSWVQNVSDWGGGLSGEHWFMDYSTVSGSYFINRYSSGGIDSAEGELVRRLKNGVWQWMLNYSDVNPNYNASAAKLQGHSVFVSKENGWVYAITDCSGTADYEYAQIWLSKDDGDNWQLLWNQTYHEPLLMSGNEQKRFIAIWEDENHVYFGGDASDTFRLSINNDSWDNAERVLPWNSGRRWEPKSNAWIYDAHYFSDQHLHLAITYQGGKIYASSDGLHWSCIFFENSGLLYRMSKKGLPCYVCDMENGKLYRIDFPNSGDEADHVWNPIESAEITVNETVSVGNTTDAIISFGQTVLKDVSITLKGNSRTNPVSNPGFETGNTSGWSFGSGHAKGVTSNDAYEGTYCLNATGTTNLWMYQYIDVGTTPKNRVPVFSCYMRSNSSSRVVSLQLRYGNQTDEEYFSQEYFVINETWQRLLYPLGRVPDWATRIRLWFFWVAGDWVLIDAIQVDFYDHAQFDHYKQQLLIGLTPSAYSISERKTINPNVTINNQTFSHCGTLENGERSSSQSYSAYMVGSVRLNASVDGSGEVDVEIAGTPVLSTDNIYLREKGSDDVYIGRYAGTPQVTLNSEEKLIAFTEIQSHITSLAYSLDVMTFTVSAYSGVTSTTQVYCGSKGEPMVVYGADSWSYNTSTTILTSNVTHLSPARIVVYWRFPGDIDGDGDVDPDDFALFAGAYGTAPPSNPDCDLDCDGDIDPDDFAIFAGDYGKRESQEEQP